MSSRDVYIDTPDGTIVQTRNPGLYLNHVRLPRKVGERRYRDQEAEYLRELLAPGTVIYCSLKSISRSRLRRHIRLYVALPAEAPYHPAGAYVSDITIRAAGAAGFSYRDKYGGIEVDGGGEDKGFALVYGLGRAIYPKGFTCVGQHCRSNDHHNGLARPQHPTPEIKHADGGYAFTHQWI